MSFIKLRSEFSNRTVHQYNFISATKRQPRELEIWPQRQRHFATTISHPYTAEERVWHISVGGGVGWHFPCGTLVGGSTFHEEVDFGPWLMAGGAGGIYGWGVARETPSALFRKTLSKAAK